MKKQYPFTTLGKMKGQPRSGGQLNRGNGYKKKTSLLFLLTVFCLLACTLFSVKAATDSSFSSSKGENCVVAPAPDITWLNNGRVIHLSSLRGKPVLLIIAPSPRSSAFQSQLNELKGIYSRLANQEMICIAAFTQEGGVIHSNIPFITAINGAAVAAAYALQKGFAAAVISSDGNLGCLSTKVLPGQRIDDLIDASYPVQMKLRRS